MKVLFAVGNDNVADSIIKKYQKEYKEILSSKKVYYFDAILKEIQKDKSYDRIVIDENLESFTNNNYDAIDKLIFEKLDNISDEAQDIDGNETSIILICTDRRTKGSSFLVKLFGIGIYNALIGSERSIDQVCKLINKPRVKKEAKISYKIDSDEVNYSNKSNEEVSELEIQNILIHFKKLGRNTDKFADSFNNIASQYTDEQLKIIVNCLPNNVKTVLEDDCKKYQELMSVDGMVKRVNRSNMQNKENEKQTGIKIDSIINSSEKKSMSGPIVIPASVRTSKNKGPAPVRPMGNDIEIVGKSEDKTNKVVKKTVKSENTEKDVESKPEKKSMSKEEILAARKEKMKQEKEKNESSSKKVATSNEKNDVDKKPKYKKKIIDGKVVKVRILDEEEKRQKLAEKQRKLEETKKEEKKESEELDDMFLPGMDAFEDSLAQENVSEPEIDETELPELENFDGDEFEDEDEELPGMEDEEFEDEDEELPGMEDEEFEDEDEELPGLDDEEFEDEDEELPGMEDEEFEEDDELPGMDDEEFEENDDELPGMEDEEFEEDDDELPGMEDEEFEEDDEFEIVDDDDEYTDEVELPELDELDDLDDVEETDETDDFDLDSVDDILPESDEDVLINDFEEDDDMPSKDSNEIESIKPRVDYSMSSLNSLLTKEKKIVTFVGTTKNGTSFLINNLAALFASVGINTAILDMTKNRNSYYIYTNNEEELRTIAYNSIYKLQTSGIAEGIKVNNNLSVYTALPNDGKDYSDAEPILSTLVQNHSVVLIDCDFDTDPSYFASCQEIYLVQSMDILTIQPLTAFLRDLKAQGVLEPEKVRVVVNKEVKVNNLGAKNIIGGMSFYNDPSMSFMTELFNKDMVKAYTIPFDEGAYSKYLEAMATCKLSINSYSKQFISKLRTLGDTVYPLVAKSNNYGGKSSPQANYGRSAFSNNTNNTLNQMKKKKF